MKKILTLIVSLCLLMNYGYSQSGSSKPIVIKANFFAVSPPLRDMVQDANVKADMTWKEGIVKNNHYPKEIFPSYNNGVTDPGTIQNWFGPLVTDTTIANFDGVGANSGVCPPDTDGDVGPNHYISVTNLKYSIYNKSGTRLVGPINNSQLFNGLPNNSNDGDAVVIYDETADRWLFSQFSLPNLPNGPFYENVAISTTADPTGSWYLYQFQFPDMPDYPKISVWPDGYYMTCNRFGSGSGSYKGTGAVAMDRTKMLAGDASSAMIYFTLPANNAAYAVLPSDCDGAFPPVGTPCYFAFTKPNTITIYEFHADWTTPANSTYTQVSQLPVASFSGNIAGNIPQKGTTTKVDPMSGRLMFRLQFRKFSDHWSMAACGTINSNDVAGIRWYELRKTGTDPWAVYQQSTYQPDNNYRWMGSIAMDSSGNMALGYSISSASMYPSIRYCGRMSSDPLNEMTIAESGIINGGGSQLNTWSGNPSRWGDYSMMSVDPSSPMTFWYTQEYYSSSSDASWKTRVGSFSFINILSLNATATPALICSGMSSQLNVTASGGSGTYTYSWTSVPPGFTSDIQNPVVSPTETTKYVALVNDGTQTKTDTAVVNLQVHPTVNAGNDTNYSNNVPLFPLFGTAEDYSHLKWTTSGDGHFTNDTVAVVLYYPGSLDRANGGVVLKLTGYDLAPCTGSVSDEVFIILGEVGIAKKENLPFDIRLIPNPSQGLFFISITGAKDQLVSIMINDLKGGIVMKESVRPSGVNMMKKMDLSALPKGTYIVNVQTDKELRTQKLVIQ